MDFLENFVQLVFGETDMVAIYELPKSLAKAIGSKTQFVYLSSQTVFKQREHHADFGARDYLILPELLSNALVLLETRKEPRLHFCYQRSNGKRYIATVKSTADGQRMYVVRLHQARKGQTKSLMKRSTELRKHKM